MSDVPHIGEDAARLRGGPASEAAKKELRGATGGRAVSGARVSYAARPGATPESERETLAGVYAFVLRAHQERQEAARGSRSEAAERRSDGSRAPTTRE
jgi:hypothetical protein